ncbi:MULTISPECIES: hypothetical protein [unclassified Methylobacterium]|uniref:hypothetical protein n=1 Tax=unclassified Methylobacterium TaxID=2615210 RepID=UPI001FB9B9C1|nr:MULTISPECIES: hypothetical protein [unclassified Methylobacterium]MCJ2097537.1 hypothetical protein [Methylobacterium sp. E-046]
MSDDEDRRRDDRKQPLSLGSDGKVRTRSKRQNGVREARHDLAVEFVDRLEQALRNMFRQ